jgi:hypothetical protein
LLEKHPYDSLPTILADAGYWVYLWEIKELGTVTNETRKETFPGELSGNVLSHPSRREERGTLPREVDPSIL